MPEDTRSTQPDIRGTGATSEGTPFCFVTDDGATVTIMLDPAQAGASPSEALVKAKDAVRCLADAFTRAERHVAARSDEVGAVFRSWAYRP